MLCESRAIVGYLDRVFPDRPLIPSDVRLAALTEQWISIVNTSMDRTLVREYVLGYVFPKGADGQPDRAAIDNAVSAMSRHLDVLDQAVARTGYLAGEQLTFADLNLMAMLGGVHCFAEGRDGIDRRSALSSYFQRLSERRSFQNTLATV